MPSRAELWEWRERIGRFRECERDTPERKQVMPGPEPPVEQQTHTRREEMVDYDSTTYMDS